MTNSFVQIYTKVKKAKVLFFSLIALFLAGCFFVATKINFEEDITRIIPKGEKNDITAKVLQQLNFSDKITVMIEAKNEASKENLSSVANEFIDTVTYYDEYIKDIQGSVDNDQIDETFEFVYDNLPLFLDEADYSEIKDKLSDDSIKSTMQQNYNTLISPTGIVAKKFILNDPLGLSFIGLEKLRKIGVSKDFKLTDGFVTTLDGKTLLLFITPTYPGTDTEHNEAFVDELYAIQDSINSESEGEIKLTYFGSPFIALANARQIKSDIQSTVLISLGILMLILVLFYRKIYIPVILFIPALCGGLVSLAVMYFLKDSISAISISIGGVLLGITIDYSLHIITHYREQTDIDTLYKHITKPILTSSITTSVAFLCLIFVNSEVLRDLGIFASISVIISAIASLIIIPQLYKPKKQLTNNVIDRFANFKFHRNKILIALCLVAIIIGVFTFSKVSFNNNIADLNFVPQPMKESEKQLENLGSIGAKSIYLSVYDNDVDGVLDKNNALESKLKKLKNEGLIEDYTSLGNVVLSKKSQKERIQKWNSFWDDNLEDSVVIRVNNSATDLGFSSGAFKSLETLLAKDFEPISLNEYDSLETLFIDEFLINKEGFLTFSSILKIDESNRDEVIEVLESEDVILIDRKHLNEQFLGELKNDFGNLMNYSFIAVFIILLIFFRRLELALVSMIPIVLTGLVTAGAMYLLGLELNIFSTIVTTLILGLGIDFSIFMTSGLQQRYTTGKDQLRTYRTSILLAVITTVLALGALIFAEHPALKSISVVSLIGILSAMIITFVFYPVVFRICIEKRPSKGKSPITFRLFITAILSFSYYGLGGVLYSILGMIIMPILPMKKEAKKRLYRKIIAKFMMSVMYSNYGLKNKVKNLHNEKFEKPAIIVPNHSSFLDTLSMGMIGTKFIFLVNDWVYNSPIFGKAVQMAGYYPVSKGIEGGEAKLVEFVKKGYSLIIFPEGTRSKTGDIGRFHKGAFHLAKKYNIDIVPLYVHGNHDLLPKGDFIIFDGPHTMEIGKRIEFNEETDHGDVRSITKSISSDFKKHYQEIRYSIEDADYFKQKIKLNFLYKTPDIVKKANGEFKNNKQLYHDLNPYIAQKTKILRIGEDLGIWDLMLVLQQSKRKVVSYIFNENYRNAAEQSYVLKSNSIEYTNDYNQKADVLLITTNFVEENIVEIVSNHSYKQIIVVKNMFNYKLLTKFDYDIKIEDTNFVILKKS
jgi:1-acyl-sn-glycerol-3-phosphate acyltransferase